MSRNRHAYNYAQRSEMDSRFIDRDAKTGKITGCAGDDISVTNYSDGSSTYHFGGPCGNVSYNEFGEEC